MKKKRFKGVVYIYRGSAGDKKAIVLKLEEFLRENMKIISHKSFVKRDRENDSANYRAFRVDVVVEAESDDIMNDFHNMLLGFTAGISDMPVGLEVNDVI